MGTSLVLMISALIPLVAALLSTSRRSALMLAAQTLSLGSVVAFMGAWRLLLDPADQADDARRQWWWTTAAFLTLLAFAYWVWVGERW